MRSKRTKVIFIEVSNEDTEFLREQYRIMAQSAPEYQGVADAEAVLFLMKLDPINFYLSRSLVFACI